MTRSWVMTALAGAALCWATAGCGILPQGEPNDLDPKRSFQNAAEGRFFRKEIVSAGASLAGCRKVFVKRVQVDPEVVKGMQDAGRAEEDLAWLVTSAGAALRSELAKGFLVLQDASYADAQTLIIDMTLTRLAPVAGPNDKVAWYAAPFEPGAAAAMELTVIPYQGRGAVLRVKDWRSGRQNMPGLAGLDGSARSDTVTIFCYWGRSLRDLLVQEARDQASRQSGHGRSALGDAIGFTPETPEGAAPEKRP